MDWFTNKPRNILEIIPSQVACNTNGYPIVSNTGSRPLNNKPIVYDSTTLREMCQNLHHDQRLRILAFGLIDKIRNLKLNNKPIKTKIHLREQQHQYKINNDNLIRIMKAGYRTSGSSLLPVTYSQ